MQDFDTKTVLDLIDENLVKVFMACIDGLFADEYEQISTNEQSSISAVVSAKKEGVEIKGFDMIDNLDCIDFINVKNQVKIFDNKRTKLCHHKIRINTKQGKNILI